MIWFACNNLLHLHVLSSMQCMYNPLRAVTHRHTSIWVLKCTASTKLRPTMHYDMYMIYWCYISCLRVNTVRKKWLRSSAAFTKLTIEFFFFARCTSIDLWHWPTFYTGMTITRRNSFLYIRVHMSATFSYILLTVHLFQSLYFVPYFNAPYWSSGASGFCSVCVAKKLTFNLGNNWEHSCFTNSSSLFRDLYISYYLFMFHKKILLFYAYKISLCFYPADKICFSTSKIIMVNQVNYMYMVPLTK